MRGGSRLYHFDTFSLLLHYYFGTVALGDDTRVSEQRFTTHDLNHYSDTQPNTPTRSENLQDWGVWLLFFFSQHTILCPTYHTSPLISFEQHTQPQPLLLDSSLVRPFPAGTSFVVLLLPKIPDGGYSCQPAQASPRPLLPTSLRRGTTGCVVPRFYFFDRFLAS